MKYAFGKGYAYICIKKFRTYVGSISRKILKVINIKTTYKVFL